MRLDAPDRAAALAALREGSGQGIVTLLTATKALPISHATVLAQVISRTG